MQKSRMPSFAIREMLEMSFEVYSVHYCLWTQSILVRIYKSEEKNQK